MAISSMREFKKVYNPKVGRYMYQHYSGGQFYKSLREINPTQFRGITGLGHQPKATHHIKDHVADAEEQAIEIGDAIIDRLRIRNNNGKDLHNITGNGMTQSDVKARIQQILNGKGLQM